MEYSDLFANARFEAPEGILTAQIKNQRAAEPDRLQLLLWFYDQAGKPVEANLTVVVSQPALQNDANGEYGRRVLDTVQRWLTSVRDGEPRQVLEQ